MLPQKPVGGAFQFDFHINLFTPYKFRFVAEAGDDGADRCVDGFAGIPFKPTVEGRDGDAGKLVNDLPLALGEEAFVLQKGPDLVDDRVFIVDEAIRPVLSKCHLDLDFLLGCALWG